MSTSNAVFLGVTAVPALEQVGWEVRVCDHTDYHTVLAVVAEFIECSIGPELSTAGTGSITLDLDSPFWQTTLTNGAPARSLREYEHLWQCYEDGVLRFEFLGRTVDEKLIDSDNTRAVVISGPGGGEVLRWAKILPPGFPAPPPPPRRDALPRGHWEFDPTWTAMRMWLTVFREAQGRGTIGWVTPLFTDLADTGGVPWEFIPTLGTVVGFGFAPEMGTDLLDFLDECTGQDASKQFAVYAEWIMWPGFRLDVRHSIGTHREDQVIFFEGAIIAKERTRLRDEIANYVVVWSDGGDTSLATDTTSKAVWNQREAFQNNNANVVDAARRNALSQVFLQQTKDEKSQWVIGVPYDTPGRRPFVDYNIGDWIGIATTNPGTASTVDAYRVLAIVVTVAGPTPTVELTLQSLLEQRQKLLERQITAILHQINNTTTPAPPVNPNTGRPYTFPVSRIWDPTTNKWRMDQLRATAAGGCHVFIQDTEPVEALSGDFWYIPDVTTEPDPSYEPDPPLLIEEMQNDGLAHLPVSRIVFEREHGL